MKVRFKSLVFAAVVLVLGLFIALNSAASPAAYPDTSTPLSLPQGYTYSEAAVKAVHKFTHTPGGTVESVREQYGVRASERYVVWTEQDRSLQPQIDDLRDSPDIMGYDLKTGKPLLVTNVPGAQTEPDVSGSIVVWQDQGRTCATCAADIMGKNLDTGATFVVAGGSDNQDQVDHAHPAIWGKNVSWVELSRYSEAIMLRNLDSGNISRIVDVPVTSHTTVSRPVLSSEYIVWTELQSEGIGDTNHVKLQAYNLANGKVTTIAENNYGSIQYAVSDHHVVWADAELHIADLSAGKSAVLYQGELEGPSIKGSIVLWSSVNDRTGKLDIWGLNLKDNKALPLVSDTNSKINPIIASDHLIWQDSNINTKLIAKTSLSTAFATSQVRLEKLQQVTREIIDSPAEPTTAAGYHVYKGIYGPVVVPGRQGWGSDDAVAEALGDDHGVPYFGSLVLLSDQLYFTTQAHRSGWGPEASDLARTYQSQGAKVIVRLNPLAIPGHVLQLHGPDGLIITDGQSPYDVVEQIDLLVMQPQYSWITNVEVDNEPNGSGAGVWPQPCSNCSWCGAQRVYMWSDRSDPRFLKAVNDFYLSVRRTLSSDQTILGKNITFWAPAMDPNGYPSDGTYLYDNLAGMIAEYQNVSYNVYPHPARDPSDKGIDVITPTPGATPTPGGPTIFGHLRNRTFDIDFSPTLQGKIDPQNPDVAPQLPSQIMEFGWEPGAMDTCTKINTSNHITFGQDQIWPAPTPGVDLHGCESKDGLPHKFEEDISYFLQNQRHRATSVNIWISRGWSDYADGIYQNNTLSTWFSTYQQSHP